MTRKKAVPVSHACRVEGGQSFQSKGYDRTDSGGNMLQRARHCQLDYGIEQLRDLQTKLERRKAGGRYSSCFPGAGRGR